MVEKVLLFCVVDELVSEGTSYDPSVTKSFEDDDNVVARVRVPPTVNPIVDVTAKTREVPATELSFGNASNMAVDAIVTRIFGEDCG